MIFFFPYSTQGEELWGLSRIAARDVPFYDSATYRYMEGDGEGVDVYIVDTGINLKHKEFEGRAVFGTNTLETEVDDDLSGHGTHVAGTVGGRTYGVAKKAKLISVKVLSENGNGTAASVLEGAEWIARDYIMQSAKAGRFLKAIVNFSIGLKAIYFLADVMVHTFIDKGLQVVIAAENEHIDACQTPFARISSGIIVGSTTKDDKLANHSNYGACIDILAPGENILSAFIGNDTATLVESGTSMAAPHVTGVIARFLSQKQEWVSPFDIRAWLMKQSSTNKIALIDPYHMEMSSTPNRLLYGSCSLGLKGKLLKILIVILC